MKTKIYLYISYLNPHNMMVEMPIVLILMLLSCTGYWIYYTGGILIVFLKLFTSLWFYPLLSGLQIDSQNVYLTYFGIKAKKLPLKQIFLYQRRYHGLDYIIFSPTALTIVTWRDIASNRKAIVYPVCGNMKNDFPDLFKDVRY